MQLKDTALGIQSNQMGRAVAQNIQKLDAETVAQVERDAIYANYIKRQEADIAQMRKDEALRIPDDFSYEGISGLSNELQQKLSASKPATLGQAGRVDGMTPAALALILTKIRSHSAKKTA